MFPHLKAHELLNSPMCGIANWLTGGGAADVGSGAANLFGGRRNISSRWLRHLAIAPVVTKSSGSTLVTSD